VIPYPPHFDDGTAVWRLFAAKRRYVRYGRAMMPNVDVTLVPSVGRRALGAGTAASGAAGWTWLAAVSGGAAQFGAAVVATASAWMALCLVRQSVTVTDSTVVVRGWLWSRRVPREAVTAVTGWPAIRWSSGGRERWTPVHALYRPGVGPRFTTTDLAKLRQLRSLLFPANSANH